ncbi:hypothetical protein G195_008018 [Phytophthora kernoviae 00238/432]|uniref:Uncharacterized protein n=1 Tax=Phytophthora kernoviae 00238/432 TaxID=1284355 RepID=A0A8J4S8J7_9STRA|nr:hypothetical protein G195_008018 [Phytophthora kernoviae 00238/432]
MQFRGKTKTFLSKQILATMLTKMCQTAEKGIGTEVENVVVTVPAAFNTTQRQIVKDAGTIAGLTVQRVINAPAAATLTCGLHSGLHRVLVFNMGGGTFDITLVDVEEGSMKYWPRRVLIAMNHLRSAYEKAKIALSASEVASAYIDIISLLYCIICKTEMRREQFELLCMSLFQRVMDLARKVPRDVKQPKDSVDKVVLVGGSTRTPKMRELLGTFVGGEKLRTGFNPAEAVASGAMMQAAIHSGSELG